MEKLLLFLFLVIPATCQATYIDRVWYFGDNQFYVYLNFNEGYDWKSHEEIKPYLSKPQIKGFESTRRNVPANIAKKYFNMPWNSELLLFDNQEYSKIGTLHFEGVEYYEDMITSSYVAVFNVADFQEPASLTDILYFCISPNLTTNLITLNPEKLDPGYFEKTIQNKYGFQDQMILRISSIKYEDVALTLCSFYDENYTSNSVLMKSIEGKNTILNEILQDEYVMWNLLLTPIIYKNMPVLIMEMKFPAIDRLGSHSIKKLDCGHLFLILSGRL